jgi:hypothetical protein
LYFFVELGMPFPSHNLGVRFSGSSSFQCAAAIPIIGLSSSELLADLSPVRASSLHGFLGFGCFNHSGQAWEFQFWITVLQQLFSGGMSSYLSGQGLLVIVYDNRFIEGAQGVEIDGNIEGHKVFRQGWLLEDNNSMSYILVYYNLFHSVLSYLSFYMPRG